MGLGQESVATNQYQLEQRVDYILNTYGPPVLVEEYIQGREFNVAVTEIPQFMSLPPPRYALTKYIRVPGPF